ncbi:MAG TPA: hypothetical protein VD865_07250 [Stenotrophomonas sp.]|nr:hypothetical protein [Stenotrophomonas sp.]
MNADRKPEGPASDQEKAHTPDRLRSNAPHDKDRDMPDEPRGRDHATPEDYERPTAPRGS